MTTRVSLHAATPELPVRDVGGAQEYYRDQLGFEIAFYNAAGKIGAVAHGECAIFFREVETDPEPVTVWVFTPDVDAAHASMVALGADIFAPLTDTAWGLRQFSLRDLNGHVLHVFCD